MMKMMNTKGNPKIHTLLLLVTVFLFGTRQAMADNVYLSLYLGNITFNTSSNLTNTAYKWNGSSWAKLSSAEALSSSNTYIIGMWAAGEDPTKTTFPAVTTINGGTVVIVGNPNDATAADARDGAITALNNWDTKGASLSRRSTTNTIIVRSPMELHICLDNVWSTGLSREVSGTNYLGSLAFYPYSNDTKLYVDLKGDNRLANVRIGNASYSSSEIHLNSSGTGTLTAGIYTTGSSTTSNHYRTVIGTLQYDECFGLYLEGGTIYAGAAKADHCTAIGAGGNSDGTVTITGGTVTAVTSCSGTAIGGGRGLTNKGGNGIVNISGGTVYAYNHGDYQSTSGDSPTYYYYLGCAIGGGSSRGGARGTATVNISGGTVYAQALGAPAIGGGCAVGKDSNTTTVLIDPDYFSGAGAAANVTISGGAVTAISKAGLIYRYDGETKPKFFRSHSAISGGAGRSGGDLTLTMTGGTLTAISEGGIAIGGGHAGSTNTDAARPGGNATISISGSNTVVDARSLEASYSGTTFPAMLSIGGGYAVRNYANSPGGDLDFTMTGGTVMTGSMGGGINEAANPTNGTATFDLQGGTIHGQLILWSDAPSSSISMTGGSSIEGKVSNGNTYNYLMTNGGGVYMENGTFDLSDGSITGCSAIRGGGVYQNGGTFNMSGGSITDCSTSSVSLSSGGGAALYQESGFFNMSGGIITNNSATQTGDNNGFLAGAIYKGGTMYVSGSPVVKGNTFNGQPNNVYIPTVTAEDFIYADNVINPDGIECGASIGVSKLTRDHSYTNGEYTNITQLENELITNNYAPIYGTYTECFQKCEFIIPAGELGGLINKTIHGLTFHSNNITSATSFGAARFQVFMKVVDATTISAYGFASGTTNRCYNGALSLTADGLMTITFSSDFYYTGGNLQIGIWETTKSGSNDWHQVSFYGKSVPGACIASQNTSTSASLASLAANQLNFIPKTTFSTIEGVTWVYPNIALPDNTSTILRNRAFFDDTETCGVYNSPVGPSYFDASSKTLYLVKYTTTNNDFFLDAASAVAGTDYTVSNSHVSSILTAKGLAFFSTDVESGKDYAGKTVTLENDLNLGGYQWYPIGFSTECDVSNSTFAGTFDGKGHVIYNLNCNYDYKDLGLFGHVTGTVKNVVVNGAVSGTSAVNVGGIIGELGSGGAIYNSMSSVSLSGGTNTGGLVGEMASGSSLRNSWVAATSVTVCDGSATNDYVPLSGYFAEQFNKTEFIIPATELTSLNGSEINQMTFYLSSPASASWGAAVYQVFLKEVGTTTLSAFQGTADATIVYEGSLDGTGTTMTVTFNSPYTYHGGNLLVGFYETTKGTYKSASFYGVSTSGTTAIHGKSPSSLEAITVDETMSFLPKITFGDGTKGGLVGNNAGTVENCYALGATNLYAANTGSVNYCYYGPTTTADNNGTNGVFSDVVKPYTYALIDNQVTASNGYVPTGANKSLEQTLNNWVDSQGSGTDYAHWARPTTATINGDYPILKMTDAEAVAANSSNPDVLHYSTVNSLISGYNTATDAIYLYKSTANVSSNSSSSAKLFIDEDAAITQAGAITANVGVTLKNTQSSNTSWDWHMFSPALSNAPLGIDYTISGTNENVNNTAYQYGYMVDPPNYVHTGTGYFPTVADTYYREWDYYCYYEPQYHWINFKRNGPSHWHEDAPHAHIDYVGDAVNVNETTLKPGKGYLLATKRETMLQAEGTLNNTNVDIAITTGGAYRTGHNLIGNPYQSYYDFNTFASDNVTLWDNLSNASYILLSGDAYTAYAYNASNNTLTAPRWLHPHQGFMIIATNSGNASFYNSKRIIDGQSAFRGDDRPNYALVNLIATDAEGKYDLTTVELGRPDKGGALKAYDLHLGHGCLYTHYENEDYAIAFTQPGIEWVGVWFETDEEGTFTMTWDTENGDFDYLHLIDNKTGFETDCLSDTAYTFTATPDDYKSRFRLEFNYTGIEEEEEEGLETFAYYADGEIHLTEAFPEMSKLQIIDMLGRVIVSRDGACTVSTNGMAPGVYVLRLTGANGAKTQKIVIGK